MDRRVKYTKMIIKETFLSLLDEKEINKITVMELCKRADVNRATFYRYYLDVYDLFDKIQTEFVNELKGALDENSTYTVFSFSKSLLEILLKEKKLAKIIFKNNNNLVFLNEMLELAYENCYNKWTQDYPNISEEDVEYAAIFIFNGALGIINYWIKNDFEKSIDDIIRLIEALSYDGTKQFINKNNL